MSFDALSFVKDYKIIYWVEGPNTQPGWVNIRCPFCSDSSNHGGFNISKAYYNCWKCGPKRLEIIIKNLLGVNYYKASEIVKEYSGRNRVLNILNKKEKKEVLKVDLPGEKLKNPHRKYLKNKNYDSDFLMKKYNLLGTNFVGEWKYRIIIPIYFNNRLVSFQGRDYTNKAKLRYKTLKDDLSIISPKQIFYNLDNCRGGRIAVMEGAPDVWRFGDNFIATLGTGMTDYQIKILSKYNTVFFIFDPGKEAQERAENYARSVSAFGIFTEIIDLGGEKDPGERSEEEVKYIRKELKL